MCANDWICENGLCPITKTPCNDHLDCGNCYQVIFNQLERPDSVHWYRFETGGTFKLRVNHIMDAWVTDSETRAMADNGLGMELYESHDCRRLGTTGFNSYCDPAGPCVHDRAVNPDPVGDNASGCPFQGGDYSWRDTVYVKVWYARKDAEQQNWPLVYDFTWQKSNGAGPW